MVSGFDKRDIDSKKRSGSLRGHMSMMLMKDVIQDWVTELRTELIKMKWTI